MCGWRGGGGAGTARTNSRVFSGMMTFWPPAWHAAQLPEKTCSPASTSAANAGKATVSTPAATSGFTTFAIWDAPILVGACGADEGAVSRSAAYEPATGGARAWKAAAAPKQRARTSFIVSVWIWLWLRSSI